MEFSDYLRLSPSYTFWGCTCCYLIFLLSVSGLFRSLECQVASWWTRFHFYYDQITRNDCWKNVEASSILCPRAVGQVSGVLKTKVVVGSGTTLPVAVSGPWKVDSASNLARLEWLIIRLFVCFLFCLFVCLKLGLEQINKLLRAELPRMGEECTCLVPGN